MFPCILLISSGSERSIITAVCLLSACVNTQSVVLRAQVSPSLIPSIFHIYTPHSPFLYPCTRGVINHGNSRDGCLQLGYCEEMCCRLHVCAGTHERLRTWGPHPHVFLYMSSKNGNRARRDEERWVGLIVWDNRGKENDDGPLRHVERSWVRSFCCGDKRHLNKEGWTWTGRKTCCKQSSLQSLFSNWWSRRFAGGYEVSKLTIYVTVCLRHSHLCAQSITNQNGCFC